MINKQQLCEMFMKYCWCISLRGFGFEGFGPEDDIPDARTRAWSSPWSPASTFWDNQRHPAGHRGQIDDVLTLWDWGWDSCGEWSHCSFPSTTETPKSWVGSLLFLGHPLHTRELHDFFKVVGGHGGDTRISLREQGGEFGNCLGGILYHTRSHTAWSGRHLGSCATGREEVGCEGTVNVLSLSIKGRNSCVEEHGGTYRLPSGIIRLLHNSHRFLDQWVSTGTSKVPVPGVVRWGWGPSPAPTTTSWWATGSTTSAPACAPLSRHAAHEDGTHHS